MPHMYNVQPFLGEELLDSGLLGRGKIQEKLQEYIPLQKPLTDGMLLGFKCHPKCSNNIKLDPLLPNGYGLWDKTLIIKA